MGFVHTPVFTAAPHTHHTHQKKNVHAGDAGHAAAHRRGQRPGLRHVRGRQRQGPVLGRAPERLARLVGVPGEGHHAVAPLDEVGHHQPPDLARGARDEDLGCACVYVCERRGVDILRVSPWSALLGVLLTRALRLGRRRRPLPLRAERGEFERGGCMQVEEDG